MANKKSNIPENMIYETRIVTTIRELVETSVELFPERPAFLYLDGGEVKEISYLQFHEDLVAFSTYLRSKFDENCKIAVTGKNCYHWALTYLAVTCGVGVIVPIDKDLRGDEIAALVEDAEADAIVYSSDMEEKMEEIGGKCVKLSMDSIDSYIEEGKKLLNNGDTSYRDHKINPHALGILLYTSGTTGVAKGVMLSQYNVCFDLVHVLCKLQIVPTDVALSIAPLHHTYETTAGLLAMIYSGVAIAYNTSLKRLQAELKLFRPTVMAVVPLVLETFRNTIIKKYNQMRGGKAVLSLQKKLSDITGHRAGRKIFAIINDTFGGRMRMFVCGAALLSPDVFRDYERFGIRVIIGYGLTETSPVSIMHNDFYRHPEDIGYPLSGVYAKLDDVNEEGVGELLVKGPNVMIGYYKNPEETARVMTDDGYFRTGDLARITPRGSYQIAGRAKSMIVSTGGKKIFPEELELFIEKSEYVSESLVYEEDKDGEKKIVCAVIADDENVASKLSKSGIAPDSEEYAKAEKDLFMQIIKDVNAKFPSYKHISNVYVRKRDFIKTTTRKIKRAEPDNTDNAD